jgi:hypothetical protein
VHHHRPAHDVVLAAGVQGHLMSDDLHCGKS